MAKINTMIIGLCDNVPRISDAREDETEPLVCLEEGGVDDGMVASIGKEVLYQGYLCINNEVKQKL